MWTKVNQSLKDVNKICKNEFLLLDNSKLSRRVPCKLDKDRSFREQLRLQTWK
ncbi:hypothetical protein J6590_063391 [Homalodisca vitripennis]|nr:hypothetical protein J6590_063391 [Homalodisca vitripennis]